MTAQALLNNDRWIQGPEFLKQPEEAWPQRPTDMHAKRSSGQRYVFGRSRFFTDGAFSDPHVVRRKPPFDSNLPIFFLLFYFFYQLFWTRACPEGKATNETHRSHARCHPYPIPQPLKVGHTTGVPLLVSNSGVGSFTSHKNRSVKVLWDGTYGFSSLSEKTRKSNHLQMSLQRQHFLLSYFKALSVGPAGVWTCDLPLSRPALS